MGEDKELVLENEDIILIRDTMDEKYEQLSQELDEKDLPIGEQINKSYDAVRAQQLRNKFTDLTRGG